MRGIERCRFYNVVWEGKRSKVAQKWPEDM